MDIQRLDASTLPLLAEMMSRINPEYWPTPADALEQVSKCIGWVALRDSVPVGWIACLDLEGYSTLEIDTMGFDSGGQMVIDSSLIQLIDECERWARQKGYANLRYTKTSLGLSCTGKMVLGQPWEELRDLRAVDDGTSYSLLVPLGFKPSGFLPHAYGAGNHGVMLVKSLV